MSENKPPKKGGIFIGTMANRETCPYYDQCGFVAFRTKSKDPFVSKIMDGEDCGIPVDLCLRRQGYTDIADKAPFGDREARKAFPNGLRRAVDQAKTSSNP